ncbi:MAG: 4'-phosphopantetheinyl transferase superfamily protein [Vicinamibacterales bacterium]
MRELPRDEVHLYYEVLDPALDAARADAARRVLTDAEWHRCQRFAYAEGLRERLAARFMVRSVLSRYAQVDPRDWRFVENAHGRPEVSEPHHATHLRFNLSHADGVVTLAVSAHYDVGVDVERLGRPTRLAIADRFFAPSEVDALRALPEAEQPRRFLEYWTLKESYIKARGAGMSLRLDQFAFDLTTPGRPAIRFADAFDDDPHTWQFDRLFVGDEHLVAVATRRGAASPVSVLVNAFDGAFGRTGTA